MNYNDPKVIDTLKDKYLDKLIDIADSDHKDSFNATKYLIEYFSKTSVGRPRKETIKQEASKLLDLNKEIEKHYERVLNN